MIKEMSFGKWLGLLVAALFLALLMYGCAGMVDLAPHGWVYSGACLLLSAAMVAGRVYPYRLGCIGQGTGEHVLLLCHCGGG